MIFKVSCFDIVAIGDPIRLVVHHFVVIFYIDFRASARVAIYLTIDTRGPPQVLPSPPQIQDGVHSL